MNTHFPQAVCRVSGFRSSSRDRGFFRTIRPVGRGRRGAILPLFALLLPILFLLSAFAINLAYMQLLHVELKTSTDAAVHAGGRAMSIHQSTDAVYDYVQQIARMNDVGGRPVDVEPSDETIQFGWSQRAASYGRYQFEFIPKVEVDSEQRQATSVAFNSSITLPLIFSVIPGTDLVTMTRRSIATQVDRDIALVLDRSGSMLTYKDEQELETAIFFLYTSRLITWTEYRNARRGYYTESIANGLPPGDVKEYISDRIYSSQAPRHCRWFYLRQAVDAFLEVLEGTDQEEQVSLVTFSSDASLDLFLQKEYDEIRMQVDGTTPYGSTAIGQGLETGLPPLLSGPNARPFAAKTIVVLTDGQNNVLPDPREVVRDIVRQTNVTIHTVTFTQGSDQAQMRQVARMGNGRHYHADEGEELIAIFEEIANNLPTILTK